MPTTAPSRRVWQTFAIALLMVGSLLPVANAASQTPAPRAVFINRHQLPADTLQMLEAGFQVRIPDGRYWYDATSGGWGQEGGPTLGFTMAGLPLGGTLPANISAGNTGVFINGRQLPALDLAGVDDVGAAQQRRVLVHRSSPQARWLARTLACGVAGEATKCPAHHAAGRRPHGYRQTREESLARQTGRRPNVPAPLRVQVYLSSSNSPLVKTTTDRTPRRPRSGTAIDKREPSTTPGIEPMTSARTVQSCTAPNANCAIEVKASSTAAWTTLVPTRRRAQSG